MKNILVLLFVLLSASASLVFAAAAAPAAPAAPDAGWLAKSKAEYPLTKCVVSGEDLSDGVDYVYKQPGKPDRLVRFCCKDCIKDFNDDPAKFVKLIDEAAAKAKK